MQANQQSLFTEKEMKYFDRLDGFRLIFKSFNDIYNMTDGIDNLRGLDDSNLNVLLHAIDVKDDDERACILVKHATHLLSTVPR